MIPVPILPERSVVSQFGVVWSSSELRRLSGI
jgi:hypothetical protein